MPAEAPQISVVIPTLGRAATRRRVLDRLATQDAEPGSFEAIVVADARDPDPESVEASIGPRPYPARALRAERPGASAARNRGVEEARGGLVLFLGDDILPAPGLVSEHLLWHRREPAETVGVLGHVAWARELRVTAFMRWLEHGMQFDYPAIDGIEAGWGRFYTANASVKRSLVERVGGFDAERLPYLYEDLDLAYRMSEHGFRLLYNRRAVGEHLHPTDLDSWRRRMGVAATAEHAFVRKHPEVPAYFHRMLSRAAAQPPARGRLAPLIRYLPRSVPWLGPRAWASADLHYRQALAPDFLAAWERAEREDD